MTTLRLRQIATLERMLHLNRDGAADLTLASQTEELVWKVLVLDARLQAIVLLVLRVNDLLRCGITIHSTILLRRSPLPDVPAVYFVEPTAENIRYIISDLESDHYDTFYINFTSSIPRELLEEFAKKVALLGRLLRVAQVFDQYLDFVVTEPQLFLLDMPEVYQRFNSPLTGEDEIHAVAAKVADGLMALVVTLGGVPIIRCARGGAAEFVAAQVDLKLRDYLRLAAGASGATPATGGARPVLILLDRSIDLLSMFLHLWIYQCMVSDVLSLKRNTIKVPAEGAAAAKQYDLDPNDFFWAQNAQLPFPDVVENADRDLNAYKRDAQELSAKTGISSLQDLSGAAANPGDDTAHIQRAVDALPELTARKATLDMHMDVLATLLKQLEAKLLDKFFEFEQNYADPKTQAQFLALLRTPAKSDNSPDKLRTYLILTLVTELPAQFATECEEILHSLEPAVDMAALNYIKKFKSITKLLLPLQDPQGGRGGGGLSANNSALLNGLSSKLYGLTEGRLTEGLSSLALGLKGLLPDKKQLPVTNVVELIMDPGSAQTLSTALTDDYLYLDPRLRGGHSKQPKRQTYQEGMVFVVGGGNYLEYLNLQEWAMQQGKPPRSVAYGSTAIVTATEFLQLCAALGRMEQ